MNQQRFLFPVDLQYFNGEKTEKATPHKRQESRKKGQVARSADIAPAFVVTLIFLLLLIGGSWMFESMLAIMRESLSTYTLWEVNPENLGRLTLQLSVAALKIVGPILGVSFLIALFANYMQVGVLFSTEPLMMKLEKINPIEGFKRIFSMRSIAELFKSILKISTCCIVAYQVLWSAKDQIPSLALMSVAEILSFAGWLIVKVGIAIGVVLIVLGILDYLYQRYEYEKNLRMSKQDIKDEYKKMEGDPLIKSKIKERQRAMAMRRMMQEIPKADVVITNPTHYAVAIRYVAGEMAAPMVIAKGQDFIALKIREIAKQHHIVTMENKPLARALYSQVEIGQSVPEEMFKAVAEVLAYVYKLRGKVK
ncbi:flagellar biosynthesis protein FlhB [Brevibacillus dissolubilis]|uniref:flagellar biosynthesis protein FlhB n=1 Tax=Brevibacillus dissolubilis TaxID=1844116 RepID=UPI001116AB9C|nr:flagellar biosynthesis protein FlhB [Brevibacillus dissolubilis]